MRLTVYLMCPFLIVQSGSLEGSHESFITDGSIRPAVEQPTPCRVLQLRPMGRSMTVASPRKVEQRSHLPVNSCVYDLRWQDVRIVDSNLH